MRMCRDKPTMAVNRLLMMGEFCVCCTRRMAEVETNEVHVGSKVVDEQGTIPLFPRRMGRRWGLLSSVLRMAVTEICLL